MKKSFLIIVLTILFSFSAFSQSNFEKVVTNWAKKAGYELIGVKDQYAFMSYEFEDSKQTLVIILNENTVLLMVPFGSVEYLEKNLGSDFTAELLIHLMKKNGEYEFASWGLYEAKGKDQLAMFYGIPVSGLDTEVFVKVSSFMLSMSAGFHTAIKNTIDEGMGFASSSEDDFLDKIDELGRPNKIDIEIPEVE